MITFEFVRSMVDRLSVNNEKEICRQWPDCTAFDRPARLSPRSARAASMRSTCQFCIETGLGR